MLSYFLMFFLLERFDLYECLTGMDRGKNMNMDNEYMKVVYGFLLIGVDLI